MQAASCTPAAPSCAVDAASSPPQPVRRVRGWAKKLSQPTVDLILATIAGDSAAVRNALGLGADINAVNKDRWGTSVLHLACLHSEPDCLTEIMRFGDTKPKLHANEHGQTAFHGAALATSSPVSLPLLVLAYGISTAVDYKGSNFLHLLMENRHLPNSSLCQCTEWILQNPQGRLLLNVRNAQGDTILDAAVRRGKPDDAPLHHLLLRYGALRGEDLDVSNRELAIQEERVERGRVIHQEEDQARSILMWHVSTMNTVNVWVRHRRRQERLMEKEALLRHETTQEAASERMALQWHISSELTAMSKILIVLKEDRAATKLQCLWRRACAKVSLRLRRENARRMQAAVAALQRIGRGLVIRRRQGRTRRTIAGIALLQRVQRGYMSRLEAGASRWVLCSRRIFAARRIMAAYRSYRLNQKILRYEAQRAVEIAAWAADSQQHFVQAVVTVQRLVRMRRARLRYRNTLDAVLTLQAFCKGRKSIVLRNNLRCRQQATDIIYQSLIHVSTMSQLRRQLDKMTLIASQRRIRTGTWLVTKLVWKESVAAFFYSVLTRRHQLRHQFADRLTVWTVASRKLEPWLALTEMFVCVAMLVTMFVFPRTKDSTVEVVDVLDIAAVILLWILVSVQSLAHPALCAIEAVLLAGATACIGLGQRQASIIYTALLMKMPFVARALFPVHRETFFYCQALEAASFQLLRLFPLLCAGTLITVRTMMPDNGLVFADTNWAVGLWQTLATNSSMMLPVAQTTVCLALVYFVFIAAAVVGVAEAFREYHEVDDELRGHHKGRLVHRDIAVSPNIHKPQSLAELGREIEVDWKKEIDVGKEAIEASHCDHNWFLTVRRFVRKVHYSLHRGGANPLQVTAGNNRRAAGRRLASAAEQPVDRSWDCRNEAVVFRWGYDVQIMEKSLGQRPVEDWQTRMARRQWTASVHKRESGLVVVVMVIFSCLYPNVYPMEAAFSGALSAELLYSLVMLGPEFVLSHNRGLGLALRLFSICVGFVPQAIPYCCLRSLRLLEGWTRLASVSRIHRWAFAYALVQATLLAIVGYVALLQGRSSRPDVPASLLPICSSERSCASTYVSWMLLPAWYSLRLDARAMHPVACACIAIFQLAMVPIILSIVLHPLLQLSMFVTRFLRLVVSSLHNDFTSYLVRYVETVEWFYSRRVTLAVKPSIAAKMRLWAVSARSRCARASYATHTTRRKDTKSILAQGIAFRQSILSKSLFRTHADNETYDGVASWRQHPAVLLMTKMLRNQYLHYIHTLLVVASISFVWATPAQFDSGSYETDGVRDPLAIVELAIHVASVVACLFLFPADFTVFLSIVGNVSLVVGLILVHTGGSVKDYRSLFVVRYLSHLRLFQLQRPYFMSALRDVCNRLTRGLFRCLVFALVAGSITCIVFMMRAQLRFVLQPPTKTTIVLNQTAGDNTTIANITESVEQPTPAYPDGEAVHEYFREEFITSASELYVFFNAWLVASVVISTCVVIMRLSCDNLMNRHAQFLRLVPFFDDPITSGTAPTLSARSRPIRYIGHVVLFLNLGFMAFADPSYVPPFFTIEVVFAACLVLDSTLRVRYSIYRSSRSSVNTSPASNFDSLLSVCDILQLIYWVVSTAAAVALFISDDWINGEGRYYYITYWAPWRYLFAFRLLSRMHHLVLLRSGPWVALATASVGVYFVAAAGVLANSAVVENEFAISFGAALAQALERLVRITFLTELPVVSSSPYGHGRGEGLPVPALLFALGVVGKIVLAGAGGFLIATVFTASASVDMMRLPPKAQRLYNVLCSGADGLSHCLLDVRSTRVEEQVALSRAKFDRIFAGAIPTWGVPHVLEASGVIAPACQRRLMFLLQQLMEYMPTKERREECVAQYAFSWGEYSSGGPGDLAFSTMPVYPAAPHAWWAAAAVKPRPVVIDVWELPARYVDPLRLVQAVAMVESWFPSTTSIESKMWQEFAVSHQKVRAAVMFQSLWRMYTSIVEFENDLEQNRRTRLMCQTLRKSFRRNRLVSQMRFYMSRTLDEAMAPFRRCYNPPLTHTDIVDRLRGRYHQLGGAVHNNGLDMWTADAGGRHSTPHRHQLPNDLAGSTSETRVRVDANAMHHTNANTRYDQLQTFDDPTAPRNTAGNDDTDGDDDDGYGEGSDGSDVSESGSEGSNSTQEGGNVLEVRNALASVSRRPLPSPPNSRQPWNVAYGNGS